MDPAGRPGLWDDGDRYSATPHEAAGERADESMSCVCGRPDHQCICRQLRRDCKKLSERVAISDPELYLLSVVCRRFTDIATQLIDQVVAGSSGDFRGLWDEIGGTVCGSHVYGNEARVLAVGHADGICAGSNGRWRTIDADEDDRWTVIAELKHRRSLDHGGRFSEAG
jgi:hypothetical protein